MLRLILIGMVLYAHRIRCKVTINYSIFALTKVKNFNAS